LSKNLRFVQLGRLSQRPDSFRLERRIDDSPFDNTVRADAWQQFFTGVYRADETVLCERAYAQRAGESMSRALAWGDAMRVAVGGAASRAEPAGN